MLKTGKMKSTLRYLVYIIALFTFASCGNDNIEEQEESHDFIPMRDFFRHPDKTRFKLSPDGKYLSYLAKYNNRLNIHIQRIHDDSVITITKESDRDIRYYFWANNHCILYLKDEFGNEQYKLYGVNLNDMSQKVFVDYDNVTTGVIDVLDNSEDEILISMNKRDSSVFDPWRLNLVTGELTLLAKNPGNIQAWKTDHNGKLRLAIATDEVTTQLLYRENENEAFKVSISTNYTDYLMPQFFTFDNKNVIALSNIGRDKIAVVEFNLEEGQEKEVLFSHPEYDIWDVFYSNERKTLTAADYYSWKSETHFFDDSLKHVFDKLMKELEGYDIAMTSNTKDENMFVIRTYSDRSLGAYYLYDVIKDSLELICEVSPWLNEHEMSEVKPIKYKSRDGLDIHGYLTLPKGNKSKNLPTVVMIHGGPWSRDKWGFDPETQFLANRGYAVLQVNFRGSVGYGKKFWMASFKQWGLRMQDDITDGVKWLIGQGIADSNRIAIYGGSYGGYAALAGAVKTPELYRCAIDYVGISNLFTYLNSMPPYWKPFLKKMYKLIGDPVEDSLQLHQTSPYFHPDKIKIPIFIAQGANDPKVDREESDIFVGRLKSKGVDVTYMVKENEGHGYANEENKFEFYSKMEEFLDKYMK